MSGDRLELGNDCARRDLDPRARVALWNGNARRDVREVQRAFAAEQVQRYTRRMLARCGEVQRGQRAMWNAPRIAWNREHRLVRGTNDAEQLVMIATDARG